jgi:hypothetical protein
MREPLKNFSDTLQIPEEQFVTYQPQETSPPILRPGTMAWAGSVSSLRIAERRKGGMSAQGN